MLVIFRWNLFDRCFHICQIRQLLKLKRQSECDAVHHFTVRPVIYVSVGQNSTDMFSLSYSSSILVSKFRFLYGCLS